MSPADSATTYTSWEPYTFEPTGVDLIPLVVNGFGRVIERVPLRRYRTTDHRWKITTTVWADGRVWAERSPEFRTVVA